jgi:hypothetical protein
MYKLKPEFYGSNLTLPSKLKAKFGTWVILSERSHQRLLKALFEVGHPAVIKNEKGDNSK